MMKELKNLELDSVRITQQSAGWMLELAEVSAHPDAAAAARWLEDVGRRAYELSSMAAVNVLKLLKEPTVGH